METRSEGIVTGFRHGSQHFAVEKWRPDLRELSHCVVYHVADIRGKVETRSEGIVTLSSVSFAAVAVEKWRPDLRELSPTAALYRVRRNSWKSGDPIRGNCHFIFGPP